MRQSLSGHMRILLRFTLEHPIVRFAFFDYFIIKNIIFKLMQEEYDLSDVKLYVLSQFKNLKGMTSQDCN